MPEEDTIKVFLEVTEKHTGETEGPMEKHE